MYPEMAAAEVLSATKAEASEEELLVSAGAGADLPSPRPPRKNVWLGCAFNLLNGTLGPGMLVLPLAFCRTGLFLGTGLVVVIWGFSYLALLLLLEACARVHTSNLVSLAQLHGPRMSLAVDWSVFLYFYGTCISYLILIGGTLKAALRSGGVGPAWQAEGADTLLLILFTLVVMTPLACSRSLDKLGAFSSFVVVRQLDRTGDPKAAHARVCQSPDFLPLAWPDPVLI
jgi:amino acid permease